MAMKRPTKATIRSSAYDGDYTDPRKSAQVDAAYDKDYLNRRDKFVEQAKAKMAKRRGSGRAQ